MENHATSTGQMILSRTPFSSPGNKSTTCFTLTSDYSPVIAFMLDERRSDKISGGQYHYEGGKGVDTGALAKLSTATGPD